MRLSKFDSIVFCSAPVLITYMFFIPGVSLAEVLMLVSLMAHGLAGHLSQVKILPWITLVFACLLLHMLLTGILGSTSSLGYFRLAKFLIIITFLAVVYEKVDRNILVSILLFMVALNIVGFLFQHAINFVSGARFALIIPFLPLVNSDLSIESMNLVLTNDFRPGGLFMEPAHLSYFLFFSGLFLHRASVHRKHIILPCICLALFGTFSSFGLLAGLILLFFSYGYMSAKIKVMLFLIFMCTAPFVASYLWELTSLIPQVARLLDPESVAVTGRLFGGGEQAELVEGANRIWGLGFGNFELDGFVNGVNYLRLSFGTAGTVIIAIVFVVFSAINYRLSYYFTALLIMSFFTSLLLTPFVLIALLPLFAGNRNEEI
jgi:hypothetical protein